MKNNALRHCLIAAAALSSMIPTTWLAAQTLRSDVDPAAVTPSAITPGSIIETGADQSLPTSPAHWFGQFDDDSIAVKQKVRERHEVRREKNSRQPTAGGTSAHELGHSFGPNQTSPTARRPSNGVKMRLQSRPNTGGYRPSGASHQDNWRENY